MKDLTKLNPRVAAFANEHPYALPTVGIVLIAASAGAVAGTLAASVAVKTTVAHAIPLTPTKVAMAVKFGAQILPVLLT